MGLNHTILPCLEGLARVAVAQGRMERAAWLCGAVAALREDMGWPLSPTKRAKRERTVAAVGGALGEEAFEAAWARGHQLCGPHVERFCQLAYRARAGAPDAALEL